MVPLCGSCGTACAASDQRCPACGRVLAASNAAATALLAGASGHPNGHVIPRSHIIALALFACCAVLTIGAGVWFFAFAPSGSGPHEPPPILTPTPPALAQPAGSPGFLVPTATPYAVPSASATSASQGSGGGGAPTPTATVPGAATATPVASLSPTPTDTPTPTVTPTVSPTPTHTPSSGGG